MNQMQKIPSPESDISFFKRISLSAFETLLISQVFQQNSIRLIRLIEATKCTLTSNDKPPLDKARSPGGELLAELRHPTAS
jgi:hypothetical protein